MKDQISRMTIDIPMPTHKKLKAIAALKGKSMRQIIVDLIDIEISLTKSTPGCSLSHKPNKMLAGRTKNTNSKKNLIESDNLEEMFKKLGI